MIIPEISAGDCERLAGEGQYWWLRNGAYVGNSRPIEDPELMGDAYVLDASPAWLAQFDDWQACADQLNPLFARYSTSS
ncbi:hypothetical protein [Mycolicibacterium sp. A43C]